MLSNTGCDLADSQPLAIAATLAHAMNCDCLLGCARLVQGHHYTERPKCDGCSHGLMAIKPACLDDIAIARLIGRSCPVCGAVVGLLANGV